MSDEADIQRGKRAQEVLDNEVYAEAWTAIEQETIRLWREARDQRDREQLHQFLLMHAKAKTALEAAMRSGEIAADRIGRQLSRAEQIGQAYSQRWAA